MQADVKIAGIGMEIIKESIERGMEANHHILDIMETCISKPRYVSVYERIFEYIRIFEYFTPNIDIHIRFVAIFKAKYYSNIFVRIFPNIGL